MRHPDGTTRGFGFVTYEHEVSVEKCLVMEHQLGGRRIDCKRAIGRDDKVAGGPGGGMGASGGTGGAGGYGAGGAGALVVAECGWAAVVLGGCLSCLPARPSHCITSHSACLCF